MLFGYLFLKNRYTYMQIVRRKVAHFITFLITDLQLSVITVTIGVVLATLSRPKADLTQSSQPRTPEDLRRYTVGILMLVISLFCTALLGLLQERTYKKYGPCWKEGVFYTVRPSSRFGFPIQISKIHNQAFFVFAHFCVLGVRYKARSS